MPFHTVNSTRYMCGAKEPLTGKEQPPVFPKSNLVRFKKRMKECR